MIIPEEKYKVSPMYSRTVDGNLVIVAPAISTYNTQTTCVPRNGKLIYYRYMSHSINSTCQDSVSGSITSHISYTKYAPAPHTILRGSINLDKIKDRIISQNHRKFLIDPINMPHQKISTTNGNTNLTDAKTRSSTSVSENQRSKTSFDDRINLLRCMLRSWHKELSQLEEVNKRIMGIKNKKDVHVIKQDFINIRTATIQCITILEKVKSTQVMEKIFAIIYRKHTSVYEQKTHITIMDNVYNFVAKIQHIISNNNKQFNDVLYDLTCLTGPNESDFDQMSSMQQRLRRTCRCRTINTTICSLMENMAIIRIKFSMLYREYIFQTTGYSADVLDIISAYISDDTVHSRIRRIVDNTNAFRRTYIDGVVNFDRFLAWILDSHLYNNM